MGPVRGFLSTAQPGRGGATVAGLAVGMSVRLQLVGKQMGGYRVHPMHAECIAGNGRFCTRRRALGVAELALSGACGGRVSANCKPQLAPSGKGVGGWVLAAGFLRAGEWVGGSESRVF